MICIYGAMRIIGGTMINGHEVVEPYKQPWTKFMENEHCMGGTMDNFDGFMKNEGGTMYNAYKSMCN